MHVSSFSRDIYNDDHLFEAKARDVHWTSESTHYGHHLRLVVIIQSRAHRTTLYLLMT